MIRKLAPLPAVFDMGQVRAQTLAAFAKALDCNQVDVNGAPNAAVYFADGNAPTAAAVSNWQAAVAAHVPQPIAPDPIDTNLPAVIAKAQAILADPANASDFTAAQRKVIDAAAVVTVARLRSLL